MLTNFNQLQLLKEIQSREFWITENNREYKLENCSLTGFKLLREKKEVLVIYCKSFTIVKRKDNKVVCLGITFAGMEPIERAKR